MKEFINRTISFDQPSLKELAEVRKALRSPSDSHAIREAIRSMLNNLKKESA